MIIDDCLTKILTVKREEFRKSLRDKRLREQLQEKRQNFQSLQQKSQLDSSSTDEEDSLNDMTQVTFESDSERVNFSRKRSQKVYSADQLKAIIKQLNKEKQLPYHIKHYENYCDNLVTKKDIKDQYFIALLSEAIYSLGRTVKDVDKLKSFNQLMTIYYNYQNFTTFQYIEIMVLRDHDCKNLLDEFCKTYKLDCSFIQWLSSNINYSNLYMINLILESLANTDLCEAFKFYGIDENLNKNKDRPEYKKVIRKIIDKLQIYSKDSKISEETSNSSSVTN